MAISLWTMLYTPALPQQMSEAGHLAERQAGNRGEQLARRGADALAVRQVAGVLVGDRGLRPAHGRVQFDARQELGDVPSAGARTRAPWRRTAGSSASNSPYSFRVEPQPAALVMIGVEAAAKHGVDIAPRQLAGFLAKARMKVQRAAASLPFGDQPPRSRSFAAPGQWLRSAARRIRWRRTRRETPRGTGAVAGRRERPADLAEEEGRLGGRRQLRQVSQRAQQFQCGPARAPASSARWLRRDRTAFPATVSAARDSSRRTKTKRRSRSASQPAPDVGFDLRARIFHQAAVAHARRAGGFAAAAGQAQARCASM